MAKKFRVNQRITAPTVRVTNEENEQLGIMAIEKALALAQEQKLDLVEVAPKADPPVCKILDFGKFQYQQKKIEQKHKKQQKQTEVKGVRIGFRTGEHDIATKAKQARKFLGERNTVKVSLILKGREAAYFDLAKEKILKFYEMLEDIANMDEEPKRHGHTIIMILTPKL